MSGSLTLPLRPLSRKKKQPNPTDANAPDYDQHDFALQIAQINAQRGSFRNVTEVALKEEIEQAKTRRRQGKGKEKDVENKGEKDESSKSKDAAAIGASDDRTEELYNGRNEVLAFAMQAHAESIYALDFISLVLTKHANVVPSGADSTISPLLKQRAPLGSIALDHTREPPDPAEDSAAQLKVEDTRTVARGWKSANFSAASKKLSRAAERLRKETEDENAFWAEIMRIKESGWTVMRAPRERNVLSVRCSSMQAGKDFRDRGLIKLRRGADGKVVLDQGLDASGPRGLRVRVERNGKVVGKSNPMWLERLRVATSKGEKIDVDERLKIKRDTLFEEELWHELGRETRALLGYNVEMNRGRIRFRTGTTGPDDQPEIIVLDLVGLEDLEELEDIRPEQEDAMDLNEDESKSTHDTLADAVSLTLRLLFSYAQRQAFEEQHAELVTPLPPRKAPRHQCQLLRPMLSYLQHQAAYEGLTFKLDQFGSAMKKAGLPWQLEKQSLPSLQKRSSGRRKAVQNEAVLMPENVIEPLLKPLTSTISLTFLTYLSINISIRTSFDFSTSSNSESNVGVVFSNAIRKREADLSSPERYGADFNYMLPERETVKNAFACQEDVERELEFVLRNAVVGAVAGFSNSERQGFANGDAATNSCQNGSDVGMPGWGDESDRELEAFDPEIDAIEPGHGADVGVTEGRLRFTPAYPELGELSAYSHAFGRRKRIFIDIDLSGGRLGLQCLWGAHGRGSNLFEHEHGEEEEEEDHGEARGQAQQIANHIWTSEQDGLETGLEEVVMRFSMDEQ